MINIKETKRKFLHFIDLKKVKSVLDIGCHKGHLSKYFLEKGIAVTGVDKKDIKINLKNFKFVNKNIPEDSYIPVQNILLRSLFFSFHVLFKNNFRPARRRKLGKDYFFSRNQFNFCGYF